MPDNLEGPHYLGRKLQPDDRNAPWHEWVVLAAFIGGIACLVAGLATQGAIVYAGIAIIAVIVVPYTILKFLGVLTAGLSIGRSYDDLDRQPRRGAPLDRDPRHQ
jgi:hypothetical protein